MAEQWLGYTVSIECGDALGVYQGVISSVDAATQMLTVQKVFKNGMPYSSPQVTFRAGDITNLSIIKAISNESKSVPSASTVAVTKPIAKRIGRSVSESLVINKGIQLKESSRKPVSEEFNNRINLVCEGNRTPSKKDRLRHHKWNEKDEACFGTPIDNIIEHEFDFEKNLALFNKQAVYDEINASQRPDIVRHADMSRRPQKYRHDENVIESAPVMYRQVIVPAPDVNEYVTDDGLIIPSITSELRRQLLVVAERCGLTLERQAELMGRAATDMALQLLGGGHRLNPNNLHQSPTVVALCGSHRQGVVGVNCARQLASHGVNVSVLLLDPGRVAPQIVQELTLYKLTHNKLTSHVQDLPTVTVDLIVMAMADNSTPTGLQYREVCEWANENRAPVLALDPPSSGTPGVESKFSLVPILPLSHSPENGKLYLCNLACPQQVFKEVGIKYASPFGPKFVIPLHPNL